jgi:RNA polymerase sigma-70 factor (ECF subfamily)
LSVTANQARELVNRIEAGDGFAESELVEQFARSVKLILVKRTGSDQLANDLCQDTFVVTLKKLRAGDLKKPHCLWAFIRQTAVNISIDHYRKEKRYIHQDDGIISLHHAHRDHKARCIDKLITRQVLEAALEQLPVSRDRDILRRFYLADEDKAKICSDLELSRTHFDRVLYRARQRMRILIKRQKGMKSMLCGSLFET